ncbi:MAG: septation regulator SpoVG [Treponema sp.]
MQITDVQIRKVLAEGKLKAYATVTFDDCFVLHNVKLIEGEKGVFVAMPSRRTKNGLYKDIAHPITPEFRLVLQEKILSAYVSYADSDQSEDRL